MGKAGDTFVEIVIALVIVMLIFFLFKGLDWPVGGQGQIEHAWTINVSCSPSEAGYTLPSGHNTIAEYKALTVKAQAYSDYVFSHWIFDGEQYGGVQITIPSQEADSNHDLTAYFLLRTPVFEVTPTLILTRGSTFSTTLYIKNNSPVTVKNVEMILHDSQNVFDRFYVICKVVLYAGTYSADIENKWSNTIQGSYIQFNRSSSNRDYTLEAYSTSNMISVGTPNPSRVNSAIQPGTYHLTFEIRFTIENGNFDSPPILTIPWTVTII